MQPPSQNLVRVYTKFSGELSLHRDTFLHALSSQNGAIGINLQVQYFAGWHGLIGLLDAWSRFCRDAIIVSALGGVVTRTGSLVAPSPVVRPGVTPLAYLKKNWPQRGFGPCYDDGPYWHTPSNADMAAKILQISNYAAFSGAILANIGAPAELKACRNYLAHRNSGTEAHRDVLRLRTRIGVSHTQPHTEKLAEQIVTGNITLFEEWCRLLDTIAASAIA